MITAILYDLAEENVLSRNNQVSETQYPTGLNANYKYFVPYEPSTFPNYDSRYYDYALSETPVEINHPVYPIYKQWLVQHILTKRSNADIFLSIENARRIANKTLIDFDLQVMAEAVIIKKINGVTLTAEENQILLDWTTVGNKLIANKQLEAVKKLQVTNNQEPDIDTGWERN